jgi:hypothetical protein
VLQYLSNMACIDVATVHSSSELIAADGPDRGGMTRERSCRRDNADRFTLGPITPVPVSRCHRNSVGDALNSRPAINRAGSIYGNISNVPYRLVSVTTGGCRDERAR